MTCRYPIQYIHMCSGAKASEILIIPLLFLSVLKRRRKSSSVAWKYNELLRAAMCSYILARELHNVSCVVFGFNGFTGAAAARLKRVTGECCLFIGLCCCCCCRAVPAGFCASCHVSFRRKSFRCIRALCTF